MRLLASLRELYLSLAVCSRGLECACEGLCMYKTYRLESLFPMASGEKARPSFQPWFTPQIRLHQCCRIKIKVVYGIQRQRVSSSTVQWRAGWLRMVWAHSRRWERKHKFLEEIKMLTVVDIAPTQSVKGAIPCSDIGVCLVQLTAARDLDLGYFDRQGRMFLHCISDHINLTEPYAQPT